MDYIYICFTILLAVLAFLLKREINLFDEKLNRLMKKVDKLEDDVNAHVRNDLESHGNIDANLINIKAHLTRLECHLDKILDKFIKADD